MFHSLSERWIVSVANPEGSQDVTPDELKDHQASGRLEKNEHPPPCHTHTEIARNKGTGRKMGVLLALFKASEERFPALWGHQRVFICGTNSGVKDSCVANNQAIQDCNLLSLSGWEILSIKQLANSLWLFFLAWSKGNCFWLSSQKPCKKSPVSQDGIVCGTHSTITEF